MRKEAKGTEFYKPLCKNVKTKCKEAKNKWIEDKCANLENTTHLSEKYGIVKELTEFIFRKTSNFPGLNIGGRKFNNIRYADDTVLLTENSEALQLLAEAVNKNSNDAGPEMNVKKKTKTMVITKSPGEEIEQVDSFKHLGQEVNDSNKQAHILPSSLSVLALFASSSSSAAAATQRSHKNVLKEVGIIHGLAFSRFIVNTG
ncbi:endonuclease-reverse transcriptase [Elysia marginata]|uniref:Endonuclease-reverse transcriptase n=1 Tax=Elysia marginata TaxID=1093978 RepID=A0AAV4IAC4_9GAST|nr:endonuclease-reverse transcriptase [Elysia marginata]